MSDTWFGRFARWTARASGRPAAFLVAVFVIAAWAVTGPIFHYSDTWQLVINTGTTIVTFLMVFLIQHTQNRDGQAIQMKLDELIRAVKGAKNTLLNLEECSEEEVEELRQRYAKLAEQARRGKIGQPPPAKASRPA
ncbi:low affinity iron permease family protein [Horticoccus luteus]|uniref:Low affinity iron permease family protein n=1 Tax=Horticoccus luteus TaxID=2862869 RepID=A0A8F9TUM7_9BACT|nr:low affinity iron permease family protein [Horticoccus luteus]QYM78093.1 low affinity iron permease family protein [Horticoccus luteus]